MKGTTQLLGLTGAAGGAFLIDCAIKGRSPWETLKEIVGQGDAQAALSKTGNAYPLNGSGGTTTGGGGGSGTVSEVIAYWNQQLGKPYCWSGTGPNCYDCSGLMWAAYRNAGVSIPRTTAGLLASTRLQSIPTLSACQPGDIILPYPGHCFGYIGNNMMIEAPHTGTVIHKAPVYKFWKARRVV